MKNQVKKQILRTVAVGISACMALQPVTVMAEEIPEAEPENTQEEKTAEQTDEFSGRADDAEREIEEAMDAVAGTSENETAGASEENAEGTAKETAEGSSEKAAEGTTEEKAEGIKGEATEGTSEETTEGTSEGAAEGTAEGTSDKTTEGASEGAAKGTAEGTSGNDSVEPSSKSDNNTSSDEQAKKTEDNKEASSDAVTKSNEAKEVVEAIDADEIIGGDIDLTEETAKLDNAVQYLEDANKELKEAKEAVKEAKKANEVILSDIKTSNEKANDAIEVLDNGTVNKDKDGEPTIDEGGMPELNSVDEYADVATDAGNAEDLFNKSVTPADDATDEYKDVTDKATDYVKNNTANTDTTGEILNKLVSDAKEADGNLENAEDRVAKAQADLDKAVKEKASADKAYDEAKALFDEAVDAYNKSSFDTVAKYGKEAEDDGIDHLDDLSNNVIAAKKGVHNAQQYIQNDRELNNDAVTSARKEMKLAEKNVNEKLKALQDARYEELVQLQKKYDEASDDDKADAREVLAKKVIEYYGLADEEGTISAIRFYSAHAYTDDKDVVTIIDGKACYISGYNEDKSPVYTEIPTRQAVTFTVTRTVEKEDGTKEEVTETRVRTFEVSENDGKISVTEVAHSNVKDSDSAVVKRERTFTEVVPEHYEDAEGETVSFEKVDEKYETTDSNGNRTMHVLDPKDKTILSQTGKKLEGANVKVVSESKFEYKENLSGDSDSAEGSSRAGFYKVTTDNYTQRKSETTNGTQKWMEKGGTQRALDALNDVVLIRKKELGIKDNETYTIIQNDDGTVTKVEISGFISNHPTDHSYITWYYTVTTTTTSTVVTEANYGTKDYAFVPETEKKDTLTYYEIGGYSNVESSALSNSVSAYATAMTYQKSARTALQTAQEAFDDTNKAYDKAKKEVDEARKAVDAMSASGIYGQAMSTEWPQAFIDAKARLEEARLKLDEALKNKAAAEAALEKAELAKDKADSAVEAARAAKKTAYEALDKAAKAKKTADDEKAAEEEKKDKDDQSKKDDETRGEGDENPKAQEETDKPVKDQADPDAGADEKDKTPVAEDDTTSEDKQSDKDEEISGKGDKGSKNNGETNKDGVNKEEKGSKDQDANRDGKDKAPVADADSNIEDEQTPSSFTPVENNARFTPSVNFDTVVAGQTSSDDALASHLIKTANLGNTLAAAKTLSNPVTAAANSDTVEEEATDTATATEAADSKSAENASDVAKTPAAEKTSPATTNIEDEDTAKAAAPVENQHSRFPWLVVVFAAIAGVSVEEYIRRKNA